MWSSSCTRGITPVFQNGRRRGVHFGFVNPDAIPNIKTRSLKAGEHRAVLPLTIPLGACST